MREYWPNARTLSGEATGAEHGGLRLRRFQVRLLAGSGSFTDFLRQGARRGVLSFYIPGLSGAQAASAPTTLQLVAIILPPPPPRLLIHRRRNRLKPPRSQLEAAALDGPSPYPGLLERLRGSSQGPETHPDTSGPAAGLRGPRSSPAPRPQVSVSFIRSCRRGEREAPAAPSPPPRPREKPEATPRSGRQSGSRSGGRRGCPPRPSLRSQSPGPRRAQRRKGRSWGEGGGGRLRASIPARGTFNVGTWNEERA
ncbi:uncharacterized protein LOC115070159 [Nannospalax galili]|uniref:uncharacterized protein LOC115070159 n=1 Tax=Nannospalax galili TaxID=1026970 RepID=UPI00111C63A0|nr:uncharacterized protein LOC115070159 [Nannospalax galili]